MKRIVSAYLFLGSGQFALALAGVSGLAVACLFQALGGAALLIVSLLSGRRQTILRLVRNKEVWISAALLGAMNALTASALVLADLAAVAIVIQLTPLFGILLAPLFGEHPNRSSWLVLLLGVAGGALVVGGGVEGQLFGLLLALASCLVGAIWMHHNAQSARGDDIPATVFAGVMMFLAGVLLLPALLFQPVPESAFLGVVLAAVCYAAGNSLQYSGTRTVPAYVALLLRPILTGTAVLWGLLALGNPLTWSLIAGAALILLSGLFASRLGQAGA